MKKPLISIIIPVFNTKDYLEKSVYSVLKQSYKNLEIILIDDGSTDESGVLCDKIAETDNRIRVFHQSNGGLSSARNLGLEKMTGELVMFVDSDDWIEQSMAETLFNAMERENADISACAFFEDGADVPEIIFENRTFLGKEVFEQMAEPLGYKFVVVWNKLYKKEIFEGVRFAEGKIHEDQWIAHEIFFKANKLVTVSDKLYHHENREGGITFKKNILKHFDDIDALLSRADFFDRIAENKLLACTEKQLFGIVKYYLSHTLGTKNHSIAEIKTISLKLGECLALSNKCFQKKVIDDEEFNAREKVYNLTFKTKLKLKFLKTIKNLLKVKK